ncbi:MAG: EamA/RhaT family transporter [Flavobacterium sp.]|uniref:EamA family transporter n=1 Tax=Flavobacterium sp. TaxID=239 RepID=UPI002B48FA34|nr:EamA/RhaT family transporter [Flavobacterium sp.]WRH74211.1 MAG: EamA/RhaT family transporter [Flavobacterium sp.]
MIYLLLSILFNAVLFIIIKLFAKFNIDALQALVVNYFVAFGVGLFFLDTFFSPQIIISQEWFKGSILLGFIFISTFYVTTITSQRNGLSVASVASKMSVIIPIILGVFLYDETLGSVKILGIIIALIAVYFTSKKETGEIQQASNLVFPILVFIGAGTIDSSLKYLQTFHVPSNQIGLFSSVTFFCAFSVGILILVFLSLKGKIKFAGRNILGGIALGLPNFFSLYYLVKMLEAKAFESATLFTIHNIAIVLVSTFVGILFFKERISMRNALGIGLALFALFLVTY